MHDSPSELDPLVMLCMTSFCNETARGRPTADERVARDRLGPATLPRYEVESLIWGSMTLVFRSTASTTVCFSTPSALAATIGST